MTRGELERGSGRKLREGLWGKGCFVGMGQGRLVLRGGWESYGGCVGGSKLTALDKTALSTAVCVVGKLLYE